MNVIKLTHDEFTRLAALVYDHTGIHLEERKLVLLGNRLRRRLKALGLASFEQYYQLISSEAGFAAERHAFLAAVTTNETYFFRNEGFWRFFAETLLPQLAAARRATTRSIRIWSAAGSSGEEACTAAILLRENLPDFDSWNVHIVASDISETMLARARSAMYSEYAVSRMSAARLARWFDRRDGAYRLKDEIRRMVTYRFHNLRDTFEGGSFDIVLLRNVLMYFDVEMKKRALGVASDALVPGGLLIVGDVDSIRSIPQATLQLELEYQRPGIYRKPDTAAARAATARESSQSW